MSRRKIKLDNGSKNNIRKASRNINTKSMMAFAGHMEKALQSENDMADVVELIVSNKLDVEQISNRGYMKQHAADLGWSTNKFIRVATHAQFMIEQEEVEEIKVNKEEEENTNE